MGKITKEELVKEMEAKRAERAARHQKFVESEKKKSESTTEGRNEIRSWSKAIAEKDLDTLVNISKKVETKYRSQNVSVDGDGGYLVPVAVEAGIVEKLNITAPLRDLFTVVPNAPAKLKINKQVARPSVAWTAEEADYNLTKVTFAPTEIEAFKLTGFVPFTEEFQNDVANYPAVADLITRQLSQEIGLQENAAFISGDGVTRPLGFRNLTLPGAQALTVANLAALDFDDIKALKRAIKRAYRGNTGFIANEDVSAQLDGIKDGNGKYVLNENVTADNEVTRLLGRRYVEADSEVELPQDELWFANGNYYWITDVAGIRVDWGYGDGDFRKGRQSLRIMKRTGGSPIGTDGFAKLTPTA